jgi:hypothetical protein
MPRPPLFATERQRHAVVAGAMLVVLLVSVGLAAVYTYRHHNAAGALSGAAVGVGDLTFEAPETWQVTQVPNAGAVTADEPDQRHRQLVVQMRPLARAPSLRVLVSTMLEPRLGEHDPVTWRESELTIAGLRATRVDTTVENDSEPDRNVIAVFVLADRRAYMICLIAPLLGKEEDDRTLREDDAELMAEVLASVSFADHPGPSK